jgi:hypothetical protein
MSGLPEVNSLVLVTVADGPPSASRIEDAVADELALAAPRLAASQALPEPGEGLKVSWSTARGLMVLPVVFARGPEGRPPVWWVRGDGAVHVEQRRNFARARVHSPAQLDAVLDGVEEQLRATVVDLSEGGARVLLADPEPLPDVGTPVTLRFSVDDELVTLAGWARRMLCAEGRERRGELAVEFEQPVPVADRLRRYVLAQQIKERRLAR